VAGVVAQIRQFGEASVFSASASRKVTDEILSPRALDRGVEKGPESLPSSQLWRRRSTSSTARKSRPPLFFPPVKEVEGSKIARARSPPDLSSLRLEGGGPLFPPFPLPEPTESQVSQRATRPRSATLSKDFFSPSLSLSFINHQFDRQLRTRLTLLTDGEVSCEVAQASPFFFFPSSSFPIEEDGRNPQPPQLPLCCRTQRRIGFVFFFFFFFFFLYWGKS